MRIMSDPGRKVAVACADPLFRRGVGAVFEELGVGWIPADGLTPSRLADATVVVVPGGIGHDRLRVLDTLPAPGDGACRLAVLPSVPGPVALLRLVEAGVTHAVGSVVLDEDPNVLRALLAGSDARRRLPDRASLRRELGLHARGDLHAFGRSVADLPAAMLDHVPPAELPVSRRELVALRERARDLAGLRTLRLLDETASTATRAGRAPAGRLPRWPAVRALLTGIWDLDGEAITTEVWRRRLAT